MQKLRILHVLRSRPRLLFSFVFGLLVYLLQPESLISESLTRALIAWTAGATFYLILVVEMILKSNHEKMCDRAQVEDEGQVLILALVILAVFAALTSVVFELAIVRNLHGWTRYAHIGLVGSAVAIAWFFTHTIFALHYAHDFYSEPLKGRPSGLEFPGTKNPIYSDFLYFAFIVGTSSQTADVSYTSNRMRRTGLVHSILSFFFNTTLLALAMNIGSSLI